MTLILLIGLGAVLACIGIAAWKIYGPQTHQPDSPASEHNGRNWVTTDFTSGSDSAPHSPPTDSSPADSGEAGA